MKITQLQLQILLITLHDTLRPSKTNFSYNEKSRSDLFNQIVLQQDKDLVTVGSNDVTLDSTDSSEIVDDTKEDIETITEEIK